MFIVEHYFNPDVHIGCLEYSGNNPTNNIANPLIIIDFLIIS